MVKIQGPIHFKKGEIPENVEKIAKDMLPFKRPTGEDLDNGRSV